MQIEVDKVGGVASAICAVHCLLTGVALGLLSVAGLGFIGSAAAEFAFLSVALLVGTWAIVHGVRKHHSYVPALIFVFGLGFIALSHLAFDHDHASGARPTLGVLFSVLGGLSLCIFHWVNLKLQRGCACGHCPHVSRPDYPNAAATEDTRRAS